MNLTDHFTVEEMACPCCQKCDMSPNFMGQLEEFRRHLDQPLHIDSGFRCPAHNWSLKDSSLHSKHMIGLAADIRWIPDRQQMLELAMHMFDGIGIGKTYVHVDKGGEKKVWVY